MTTESMTPDVPATPAAGRPDDAAGRGRTVIDDRVRRKLVEHAVLSVPGTERTRGLTTRQFPAVRFADRARSEVDVQIAAQWPLDAGRLVPAVRSAVDDELSRSLGAAPEEVHVHITRINDERTEPRTALAHRVVAETDSPPPDRALRRHAPRRAAGASIATVPLLLAVIALGAIAVRDAAVSIGWVAGSRWIDAVPRIADDVRWSWWAWPASVGAVVLGLVLVIAAVKPRRRSHAPVSGELWFHRRIDPDRRNAEEVAR
ncbi:hypothetical protein [Tsukamurella paurometabola]|uniref:Asp23/Gls24 family envelope stress response protein n=1 Tax=Tsukamurella paurometabola TaxID=2061 RepID=A0A3P8L6D1_TSUPA|nr:hypothetical protein [Tsukamurella paurometabola]MBS4102603.1 hypothetical protein [Tsukamurella paurometabola]UEA81671.1 hypothetical protein LK411_14870 [Tsukamurella paurometabola]VDR38681.1 Uncharacterised protein [Tsukamurella paurometabola]